MAEFGPSQTSKPRPSIPKPASQKPLQHKNKGVLAGQLGGARWVENTDARDEWAAKYGPRTTRDCGAP